jgi:predicted metal-dependent phosphoesterase TrpH
MIDLHTHSIFSDGNKTPAELVERANAIGVRTMALTDHDTVDGIPEFLATAKKYPDFRPIIGCEISAGGEYDPLHILALNIKDVGVIAKYTAKIRKIRLECMKERIGLLQKAGIDITFGEVLKETVGTFTKVDLMRVMIKRRIATDVAECKTYFAEGGVANFDNSELFPDRNEIVEAIINAKAIPVLAHPYKLKIDGEKLRNFVKELIGKGLMGIECYHSNHTAEQTQQYLNLAKEFNLIISGGSDYHAKEGETKELGFTSTGVKIPEWIIEQFELF